MTTGVGGSNNPNPNNNNQGIDAKKLGFPLPVVFTILSHADDKTKSKLVQLNKTFEETVFTHVEFNAKEVIDFFIDLLSGEKYKGLAEPELVKALHELKEEDQDLYVAHTISKVQACLPVFKRKLVSILMRLDSFKLNSLKYLLKEFGNPVMYKDLIDLAIFHKKVEEIEKTKEGYEQDQALATWCEKMAVAVPEEVIFIAETKIVNVAERSRALRTVAVEFFNSGKVKLAFNLASKLHHKYQYYFVADLLKSKSISPEVIKELIAFAKTITDKGFRESAIKEIFSQVASEKAENEDLVEYGSLLDVENNSSALEGMIDVLIKQDKLLEAAKLSTGISDNTTSTRVKGELYKLLLEQGLFLEAFELVKTLPFELTKYTALTTILEHPKAQDVHLDVMFELLEMKQSYEQKKGIEAVISKIAKDYKDKKEYPSVKLLLRLMEVIKTVGSDKIKSIEEFYQLVQTLANEHKKFAELLLLLEKPDHVSQIDS